MKVEPAGVELLRVARASLLESLLPLLPAESHYTARMVANAMAIAARELEQPSAASVPDAARLAREIREGRHDAGEIAALLREITRARLAVSNPRLLGPVDKR
jgi:hypothetical protein